MGVSWRANPSAAYLAKVKLCITQNRFWELQSYFVMDNTGCPRSSCLLFNILQDIFPLPTTQLPVPIWSSCTHTAATGQLWGLSVILTAISCFHLYVYLTKAWQEPSSWAFTQHLLQPQPQACFPYGTTNWFYRPCMICIYRMRLFTVKRLKWLLWHLFNLWKREAFLRNTKCFENVL